MSTGRPIGSVVIPAHNEAAVIRRCLTALFDGVNGEALDVVVACNGCTDGTAETAASAGLPVSVLEISEASKTAALRAADAVTASFPRIYLDADVVLPGGSALQLLQRLRHGPALAGRPPLRYDATQCTSLVRRYYRARSRIPTVMGHLWGAGVYGLSEQGRARFGVWPDVVSDDVYVDRLFDRSEVEIVDAEPVVVSVPRRSTDLVRVLRRTHRGPLDLDASGLGIPAKDTVHPTSRDLVQLAAGSRSDLLDASAYIAFALAGRLATLGQRHAVWERDQSSRAVT